MVNYPPFFHARHCNLGWMLFSLWVVNREWLDESKVLKWDHVCFVWTWDSTEEWCPQPKVILPCCGVDNFVLDCGFALAVIGFISGTHQNAPNSGKKVIGSSNTFSSGTELCKLLKNSVYYKIRTKKVLLPCFAEFKNTFWKSIKAVV